MFHNAIERNPRHGPPMPKADPDDTKATAGLEALAAALEDWFELPFDALPAELQPLVARHFLGSWNSMGPVQRRDVTSRWQSLGAALKESFAKQRDELPPKLRRLVDKHFPFREAWDILSPARRRSVAWQWDIDRHPDLQHERNALLSKSDEVEKCQRIGSNVPLENRQWKDVQEQAAEVRNLRAEEAALELLLLQKAESLGLHWADLTLRASAAEPGASVASTTNSPARPSRKPRLRYADVLVAWEKYLKRHPDPERRPNTDAQRAAMQEEMAGVFPNYGPLDERTMQRLRAEPITPTKWRTQGRRKEIQTGNQNK